jgi:hypothetical protein
VDLTPEERARITDSKHKIQSVADSLTHVDPQKIPGFDEIEEAYSQKTQQQAVIFEQTAEAFSAVDRSRAATVGLVFGGKKQEVALALVIPLSVKVLHELTEGPPQRGFAEYDQFRKTLLLH